MAIICYIACLFVRVLLCWSVYPFCPCLAVYVFLFSYVCYCVCVYNWTPPLDRCDCCENVREGMSSYLLNELPVSFVFQWKIFCYSQKAIQITKSLCSMYYALFNKKLANYWTVAIQHQMVSFELLQHSLLSVLLIEPSALHKELPAEYQSQDVGGSCCLTCFCISPLCIVCSAS